MTFNLVKTINSIELMAGIIYSVFLLNNFNEYTYLCKLEIINPYCCM